jgi:hypothetical protein
MVCADALVDLPQYVITIFLCDALHENSRPSAMPIKLAIDQDETLAPS